MNLVMTLLVRDEEDIIETNIEYHLAQGVDLIIATDNKSVDSTTEILRKYEALGVLHYIYEGSDDYSQHKWVTKMARMAHHKYGASWVINSDADEFWWPIEKDNLKNTFDSTPGNINIIFAQRHNFVYIENATSRHFYRNMIYRETNSTNSIGRPLSPKAAHIGSDSVIVEQGNHSAHGIGPHVSCNDVVEIFHFPVRSETQIVNKILKGGAAYERNTDFPESVGKTWRDLYKMHRDTGNLSDYVTDMLYDENRISVALKNGSILLDTRLRDYLDSI